MAAEIISWQNCEDRTHDRPHTRRRRIRPSYRARLKQLTIEVTLSELAATTKQRTEQNIADTSTFSRHSWISLQYGPVCKSQMFHDVCTIGLSFKRRMTFSYSNQTLIFSKQNMHFIEHKSTQNKKKETSMRFTKHKRKSYSDIVSHNSHCSRCDSLLRREPGCRQ